jgi:hypothetical protein
MFAFLFASMSFWIVSRASAPPDSAAWYAT